MKFLDYNMPSHDRIVILGAGPSLIKNKNEVQNYAKDNCLVIGTSYNFYIPSNYTMIVGKSVFRGCIKSLKCKNVFITNWVYKNNKSLIKSTSKKFNYWMIRTSCDNPSHEYWNGGINVKDGVFDHHLSNCGFTALLASHFFRPKEVMIVGFDGPDDTGYRLDHFDGNIKVQKGLHKDKKVSLLKGEFLYKIVSFLKDRGSKVIAFKNDGLWGMPKDKHITII